MKSSSYLIIQSVRGLQNLLENSRQVFLRYNLVRSSFPIDLRFDSFEWDFLFRDMGLIDELEYFGIR
jgi:hypothetical protein